MIKLPDELFRAAFAHSAACKLIYTPDRKLVYMSPGLYRLLSYLPETLDQTQFSSLCHPADLKHEHRQFSAVLAGQTAVPIEKRLKNSQGEWIWVQQQLTAISLSGQTEGIQCLIADIQDIRSRKQVEAAHEAERARLLMVEAIAQLGSWQINAETGQFWLSDSCYRLLGYQAGEIEPGDLLSLSFVHPEDQNQMRQSLNGLSGRREPADSSMDWLDAQGEMSLDFRLLRPNGEIRYVTSKIHPIYSEQGQLLTISGFLLDVTAFSLKEQLLQDAHQLLQRQHQHLRELGQRLLTSLKQPLSLTAPVVESLSAEDS